MLKKVFTGVFLLMGLAGFCFDTVDMGLKALDDAKVLKKTKLEIGKIYHDLASLELRAEWIDLGSRILEEEYESTADPEALAYWGSLITIEGNLKYSKGDLIGALTNLEEGGKKIDQAIELDKKNINLRFLRIANGISVSQSSPVDRTGVVKNDIKYMETVVDTLMEEDKAMFYYYRGNLEIALEEILNALESFDLAVEAAPNSKYAKLAKKELAIWEE